MSCPAITNKGGKLSISRFPVACELTLSELALLDYAVVPGVGSIGDTGIEQDISSYSTVNAGISPQSKAAAVGKAWDVEMIESQSAARDVFETASAVGNKDTYATRIEWPDGAVEFSIVQVSSPTYVKGAPSGVRIVRYTMIPSFIPIVTNSLPVASNVVVAGSGFVGSTLVATYDYYSPLGLPESGSVYQWYADGVAIPGETSTTLILTGDHIGSLITFGVTPSDGLSYGHEVISGPVGPVADSARFTADAPGLYTDTALTVPVTSYGDAVAGWRGAGLVGVQPTLTARPAYGRMPSVGVRNLFAARSDDRAWTNGGQYGSGASGTVTTGDGFDTLVRTSGPWGRVFHSRNSGLPVGTYITLTAEVRWASGSGMINRTYDGTAAGLINVEISIPTASSEWQPLRVTVITTSTANQQLALTLGADGTSVDARYVQVEYSEEPTAYQSVGTGPYDVTQSGVPDTPILYYDLGDDVLPAAMTLPAITSGTLVIAGEEGIWIDDSFSHAGGSWSLGPTTYTGGPAGLLPSLIGNRVLGFAVFAGQLSPAELQVEVAYWMARGAPGVWERGSQLFSGSITVGADWVDNGGGSYTKIGSSGGADGNIATANSVPVGALIDCERTVTGRTGGSSRIVTNTVNNVTANSTSNGLLREIGLVTNAGPLAMGGTTPFDGTVTGISLKQLTLNTDPYP